MPTDTMTIRIPREEKQLIRSYADLHGITMTDMIRRSVLERIEDEFDLRELEEAERTASGEYLTFDEMCARLGIET